MNSAREDRCYRCGASLPGPWGTALRDFLEESLGREFPLTKVLVGACAGIYIFAFIKTGWTTPHGILGIGQIAPSEAARWGALVGGIPGEKWRYLSAVFVHYSVLHVLFNSMAVFSFGRNLEAIHGSARFAVLFVLTGALGFVLSDYYYEGMQSTAGASGSIFGLIGAQAGYLFGQRDPMWKQVATQALIYGLIFAVAFPVNNVAHAGGFLVGAPLGYLFYREKYGTALVPVYRVLAVVLLLASLGAIYLAHTSPVWEIVHQIEQRQR